MYSILKKISRNPTFSNRPGPIEFQTVISRHAAMEIEVRGAEFAQSAKPSQIGSADRQKLENPLVFATYSDGNQQLPDPNVGATSLIQSSSVKTKS